MSRFLLVVCLVGLASCVGSSDSSTGGGGGSENTGGGGSNTGGSSGGSGGGGTAPTNCSTFQVPLPSEWTRLSSPNAFSNVQLISGGFWNPFPSGGGRGILGTPNTSYISIEFTTPTNVDDWNAAVGGKEFLWDGSQVAGAAILGSVYVTISECAGDFRIPTAGTTAPVSDPTYARGCRNLRPVSLGGQQQNKADILYEISAAPSTDLICRLAAGRTYHLNFIRANASDGAIGVPTTEAICANFSDFCGIDMDVR